MTFAGLFMFAAFLVTRQLRWLLLGLAFSLGTILSARRRAILSLLAGLLAAFVESLRTRPSLRTVFREWWPIATGVGVLLIAFIPVFLGLVTLTVDRFVDTPGVVPGEAVVDADDNPPARGALYIGAVEIASDRLPLGVGLGRYASWMSRIEYSPVYEEYGLDEIRGLGPDNPLYATDTFWPQILGEFGVIGFAAYLAFLGTIGYRLWRESGRPEGGSLRVLRLGAGMVFVQALVESAANAMFHSPPRVYLLFLVVGAVMSIGWRTPASSKRPPTRRPPAADRLRLARDDRRGDREHLVERCRDLAADRAAGAPHVPAAAEGRRDPHRVDAIRGADVTRVSDGPTSRRSSVTAAPFAVDMNSTTPSASC